MLTFQQRLQQDLSDILKETTSESVEIPISRSEIESHGDYSTSVALALAKTLKKNPMQIATELVIALEKKQLPYIEQIETAPPGFINIWLKKDALIDVALRLRSENTVILPSEQKDKRIMVEYAHPNTHKEMHIGHMRTLITGESVARLLESVGVFVFRANYQGDIGLHVAKAMFGIKELMRDQGLTLSEIEKWPNPEKAHFLGQGYAKGSTEYELH